MRTGFEGGEESVSKKKGNQPRGEANPSDGGGDKKTNISTRGRCS